METPLVYEIIGYVASVLIAISMMMSGIMKLRIVNMIGAAFFSVYGVLIGSIPVAALNGFIVLVNIFYLIKMFQSKEYFRLLRVKGESNYLRYFLNFYEQDIQKFQPEFTSECGDNSLVIFVLRDLVPAGLIIGDIDKDGIMQIRLDYVIPNYRDLRIGKFVFMKQKSYFRDHGVQRLEANPGNELHQKYLTRLGFVPDANGTKFVMNV